MAELLADVLPSGVVNVVCGGPDVGSKLAAHPHVAMVSVTGSPRTDHAVALAAAERFARVHLELGGNAPVVICEDADLDTTVEQVAFAAFNNAGQDCTAASRVIAHEAVYDEVVQRLAEAARDTTIGPLISAAQRARVVALLEGTPPTAKIVAGGGVADCDGFFLEPTVVATDSHSRALRFLRDLDFGAVSVNAHAPMGSELPHGGFGSSGYPPSQESSR